MYYYLSSGQDERRAEREGKAEESRSVANASDASAQAGAAGEGGVNGKRPV